MSRPLSFPARYLKPVVELATERVNPRRMAKRALGPWHWSHQRTGGAFLDPSENTQEVKP